uniref:Uncharacterized protein n=1 Tax=Arundo donax TaxID=35708 RepID=A0A0A9GFT5_ARUDO
MSAMMVQSILALESASIQTAPSIVLVLWVHEETHLLKGSARKIHFHLEHGWRLECSPVFWLP